MPLTPGLDTALQFSRPAAADADLVFGENYVPPRAALRLRATLAPLSAAISFIPPVRLQVQADLPGLGASAIEVRYASRTQRPTVGQTMHEWQPALRTQDGPALGHQDAAAAPAAWGTAWQRADPSPHGIAHLLPQNLLAAALRRQTGEQRASRLLNATGFGYADATHLVQTRAAGFQTATRVRDATRFAHQDGGRDKRAGRVSRWQNARRMLRRQGTDFQRARGTPVGWLGRYQEAMRPQPGVTLWVRAQPPDPPICYQPSGLLLFAALAPAATELLFVCARHDTPGPGPQPNASIVIPVRRVYVVINEVSLTRIDGSVPIHCLQFSISIDVDSWTWSFSARVPARQLADLQPGVDGDLVLLHARVNGTACRVAVESIARERTFGADWLQVSGRGINAALDSPYAPVLNFGVPSGGLTAAQLMEHVLQDNGVPLGWTVDWQLAEDWAVPEGAWTLQGSYMAALNQIASAGGGYIQPHLSDQTLRVLPRYPALPWAWPTVTPDISLPAAVVQREGTQWVEKPSYNRVFVSGQGVGVLTRVTRAGSDGGLVAPMVVDPLITAGPAGRMRAEAVLSDTGRQAQITLRTPVLPASGLILPGQFVRYHEGAAERIGLARGLSVEVAGASTWQSIVLETHV